MLIQIHMLSFSPVEEDKIIHVEMIYVFWSYMIAKFKLLFFHIF